ncbi:hypothetical protein KQI52_06075 [bacterium]|nr:hypothetical protein [bacterium]
MKTARHTVLILLILAAAGSLTLLGGCGTEPAPADPLAINFAHLEHLTESVTVNGRDCDIVHIYANAPSYDWTGDDDEGNACVDDVARAARLYLREYEATGDTVYAARAKRMLQFVLAMQTDTGHFANFIWPDRTLNLDGRTSKPSLNFWAARAMHALALGQRVLADQDPEFVREIDTALAATIENLTVEFIHRRSAIGIDAGSDIVALFTLALLERRKIATSAAEDSLIVHLAERIHENTFAGSDAFPYRVHLSWRNVWHQWGMQQVEALAYAGQAMNRPEWIASAREEAENFQRMLLANNGPIEFKIEDGDTVDVGWYSQIAYGTNSLAACQRALFEITGDEAFAAGCGLAVGWLTGLNPAGATVYDPGTGRVFDGINSRTEINRNSGAESTIEGLLALQELRNIPGARQAALATRVDAGVGEAARFVTPDDRVVTLASVADIWRLTIADRSETESTNQVNDQRK